MPFCKLDHHAEIKPKFGSRPKIEPQTREREKERERERALLVTTVHNGGARAAPAARTPHDHALFCLPAYVVGCILHTSVAIVFLECSLSVP